MRLKTFIRSIFIGILFSTFSVVTNAKIDQLDIQQPRSFGYQIGDKFERVINLRLQLPYVLEENSLPKQGRLTEWITLEKPIIDFKILEDIPQYTIKLTYQIVNIKSDLEDIPIPSHMFLYKDIDSDSNKEFKFLVPATRVRVSTLTNSSDKNLQPDRAPILLPHSNFRMFLYLTLLLSSLAGLAYLKWGLPFLSKKHPFANAYKLLNQQRHIKWNDDRHREALEQIHKAFNETAQRTVFIEKLDVFFNEHKKFSPLKTSIEDYFTYSRKYFFEGENDQTYSLPDLINFVEQCRDVERGIV